MSLTYEYLSNEAQTIRKDGVLVGYIVRYAGTVQDQLENVRVYAVKNADDVTLNTVPIPTLNQAKALAEYHFLK